MKTIKLTTTLLALALAAACGEGEQGPAGPAGPAGPQGPAGATGPAGMDGDDGTNGTDGMDGDDGMDGADGMDGMDATAFQFRTDAPSAYTRVDRMGMPAVSTALVMDTEAYNDADPNDDVMNGAMGLPQFVESDIAPSLAGLHEALRDDLAGAGLTRCSTGMGAGINVLPCATQEVAPGLPVVGLIVPDTLTLDPTVPAGFPNGRRLVDPVIDVTLAVILLDLSVHSPAALVGALNPAANDVAFDPDFPYLAYPHVD